MSDSTTPSTASGNNAHAPKGPGGGPALYVFAVLILGGIAVSVAMAPGPPDDCTKGIKAAIDFAENAVRTLGLKEMDSAIQGRSPRVQAMIERIRRRTITGSVSAEYAIALRTLKSALTAGEKVQSKKKRTFCERITPKDRPRPTLVRSADKKSIAYQMKAGLKANGIAPETATIDDLTERDLDAAMTQAEAAATALDEGASIIETTRLNAKETEGQRLTKKERLRLKALRAEDAAANSARVEFRSMQQTFEIWLAGTELIRTAAIFLVGYNALSQR